MKALVYEGEKKACVREVGNPTDKNGTIRLNLKYCGICGTDIGIYAGTHPRAKAPLIFGHEFLGTVVEDGKRLKKGDRVVPYPLLSCGRCLACRTGNEHVCSRLGLLGIDCDGGVCESICVDEEILYKVPDHVSDVAASVIEPLAVVIRAVHQSGFKLMDTCAVIGAGPIGILTGIVLKFAGASKVFISDVAESRLKKAEGFGMIPVNPLRESLETAVKEATDKEGCDTLFECSGAAVAATEMTDITRVGGNICMVSIHKKPHEVNLRDTNFKEQHIVGSRVYTREEFRQAVELSKLLQPQLEQIVTHIVPLAESEKVFDMIADPDYETIKVVVDCEIKSDTKDGQ